MDLGENLTMAASMFHIAINHKNKPNMRVAASNITIKIHQPFLNNGFLVSA